MTISYLKARKPQTQPALTAEDVTASVIAHMTQFANEAYGVAASTTDPQLAAYAQGVEDLARWLASGQIPTRRFGKIARGVEFRAACAAELDRHRTQAG